MNIQTKSRASIRDVAREAGVSPSCASNVITGRRARDDAIGVAVMEAVKSLGYRRNTIASSLRSTQSKIAGLLIPDIENPFFASLVSHLEIEAEKSGFRIVTVSSREDAEIEQRELDELIAWNPAGILLIPARRSLAQKVIEQSHASFVMIDRPIDGVDADIVVVNNREASADAMRAIIELGHKRILVLFSGANSENMKLRRRGVEDVIEDGIKVEFLKTGFSVDTAREAIGTYLDQNDAPTAIFSLYNPATLASYGLALERGFKLGGDLSLVGFDDSKWMEYAFPAVTAIAQPVDLLAKRAWEIFLERILGGRESTKHEYVQCTFKQRGTLAPSPVIK